MELTCQMGSHSVTGHPAEVTFPPLLQPKLLLDLATTEGCKAELTCGTDRRTEERSTVLYRPCSAYHAGGVKN